MQLSKNINSLDVAKSKRCQLFNHNISPPSDPTSIKPFSFMNDFKLFHYFSSLFCINISLCLSSALNVNVFISLINCHQAPITYCWTVCTGRFVAIDELQICVSQKCRLWPINFSAWMRKLQFFFSLQTSSFHRNGKVFFLFRFLCCFCQFLHAIRIRISIRARLRNEKSDDVARRVKLKCY